MKHSQTSPVLREQTSPPLSQHPHHGEHETPNNQSIRTTLVQRETDVLAHGKGQLHYLRLMLALNQHVVMLKPG